MHRVARALPQLASPVTQVMGLAAHRVAGIVQRLCGMGKSPLHTVDRITQFFAQAWAGVRRARVERAILIEAQPRQAKHREGGRHRVVFQGGAQVMEELPAAALAVSQYLVHQLAGAQALLQGIDQVTDMLALGIDLLLEQVRVFLRFLFERSAHGSFLFSASLSCCRACSVRSGAS
ncbi:hypothetical protein D3C79_871550 [compost metagenome]